MVDAPRNISSMRSTAFGAGKRVPSIFETHIAGHPLASGRPVTVIDVRYNIAPVVGVISSTERPVARLN